LLNTAISFSPSCLHCIRESNICSRTPPSVKAFALVAVLWSYHLDIILPLSSLEYWFTQRTSVSTLPHAITRLRIAPHMQCSRLVFASQLVRRSLILRRFYDLSMRSCVQYGSGVRLCGQSLMDSVSSFSCSSIMLMRKNLTVLTPVMWRLACVLCPHDEVSFPTQKRSAGYRSR
jgi:hypothetical protein